jgi:L-amino acid N-acyltransferase YncA
MSVKIRPIVLEDAAGYRRAWDAVAREGRYFYEEKAPPLADVRKRLRGSLRKKTPFLVAVDDGSVVGWAAMFSSDIPSLRHCGIVGIALLPEYREKGFGTKLMKGILKLSRGRFEQVLIDVLGKNKRAQGLYKKMGFKQCGRFTKHVKLSGGYDDMLFMEKSLAR